MSRSAISKMVNDHPSSSVSGWVANLVRAGQWGTRTPGGAERGRDEPGPFLRHLLSRRRRYLIVKVTAKVCKGCTLSHEREYRSLRAASPAATALKVKV